MAQIKHSAGNLTPPACYSTEQERFEAYVAKIISTFLGGFEWEDNQAAPVDLTLYWLKRAADQRHVGARKWSTPDARWAPWLESLCIPESSGGAADAYTATTGHALTTQLVKMTGRRFLFIGVANNTGASTLNVDGIGAVPIVRHGAEPLLADDIVAGCIYEVVFNAAGGGRFEMVTPLPPSEVVLALPTYITTPEFSVPAHGSFVEVSHSGGKVPAFVRVVAVCKTGSSGYSVGDELAIEGIGADISSGEEDAPAYLVNASASKITVSAMTAGNGQTFPLKTGGVGAWNTASVNFTFKAYLCFLP